MQKTVTRARGEIWFLLLSIMAGRSSSKQHNGRKTSILSIIVKTLLGQLAGQQTQSESKAICIDSWGVHIHREIYHYSKHADTAVSNISSSRNTGGFEGIRSSKMAPQKLCFEEAIKGRTSGLITLNCCKQTHSGRKPSPMGEQQQKAQRIRSIHDKHRSPQKGKYQKRPFLHPPAGSNMAWSPEQFHVQYVQSVHNQTLIQKMFDYVCLCYTQIPHHHWGCILSLHTGHRSALRPLS